MLCDVWCGGEGVCGGDEFSKRLQAGVKWVSSIDIHPGDEGVCVCVVCVCCVMCGVVVKVCVGGR